MIIDKEFHSLIPPLTPEEYKQLESNILADGIRDPLITWQGILIDGHNRYQIAQEHGLEYQTAEKLFEGRGAVTEWMICNQFGRRNLSNYQRSLLALKLKPVFEAKAKENLKTSTGGNAPRPLEISTKVDTRQEIARLAGVSDNTIAKVQKIEEQATPEVKAKIATGETSINQAYQQIRKAEKVQEVESVIAAHSTAETGVTDIFSTDKKYNIVYADPAWTYGEWGNGTREPGIHYNLMKTEDIAALPVSSIAADDCILFMWATYPLLPEALDVVKAWGFKYKTVGFVWVKKNKNADTNFFGLGGWTRANSEICIIGVKGNITRMDAGISQVIESAIEEHSRKPAVTRTLITKLVGELPRIELFSREKTDGWDCWGNEV